MTALYTTLTTVTYTDRKSFLQHFYTLTQDHYKVVQYFRRQITRKQEYNTLNRILLQPRLKKLLKSVYVTVTRVDDGFR